MNCFSFLLEISASPYAPSYIMSHRVLGDESPLFLLLTHSFSVLRCKIKRVSKHSEQNRSFPAHWYFVRWVGFFSPRGQSGFCCEGKWGLVVRWPSLPINSISINGWKVFSSDETSISTERQWAEYWRNSSSSSLQFITSCEICETVANKCHLLQLATLLWLPQTKPRRMTSKPLQFVCILWLCAINRQSLTVFLPLICISAPAQNHTSCSHGPLSALTQLQWVSGLKCVCKF